MLRGRRTAEASVQVKSRSEVRFVQPQEPRVKVQSPARTTAASGTAGMLNESEKCCIDG